MPAGLGTRKCRRSRLLQEGSDANYELPELRFHMRLGSRIPSLPDLCWELRGGGARLRDGGAEGTSSTAPGFRELSWSCPDQDVLPSTHPGPSAVHSSSCPAGTSFFLSWKPKSRSGRHWRRLASSRAWSLWYGFCMGQMHGGRPSCLSRV